MNSEKPNSDVLKERILEHLEWSNDSEKVALIWHGYIFGLFEWGLIDLKEYRELNAIRPYVGRKELYEMALGEKTDISFD